MKNTIELDKYVLTQNLMMDTHTFEPLHGEDCLKYLNES